MGWARSGARHGLRSCVVGLTALAAVLAIGSNSADARRHHHRHRTHIHLAHHSGRIHHYARSRDYSPPTASIIVDGNSGAVLEQSNPDALRHPASLTKVMTLYLLFERLQSGRIKLDTPLTVSEHAAEQAPTKLGLKPGQTISVEAAIKAVVTRSANDVAVVIAEGLGGSEDAFARLMTQKARELGMSRTTYVNASGLPDDDQLTTARDQALLGRAIQDRFPVYYRFFSTTAFTFHGDTIRGHNHLLSSMPGVDGIKTGFTRASGFNLITSLHRDGRYVVGVVLGGRSAFERDAHMRQLLNGNFRLASTRRTAPVLAERAEPHTIAATRQPARPHADPIRTATATPHAAPGSSDPIRPIPVRTITYRTVTVRTGKLAAMPVMVPAVEAPAVEAPAVEAHAHAAQPPPYVVASAEPVAHVAPPHAEAPAVAAAPAEAPRAVPAHAPPAAPPHAHSGWMIQIGAFEGEAEARQHLTEAQHTLHALTGADPFTEPVHKGDTTLYRARFAGLNRATAEAACRQLKRNDFACMALKD
jgi:D-alanyl-D-alanine carboxypeptidase